ncbi:hypothetical protein J5N97_023296 [Dioscorea zingiberensis]|uniref:Uncharacterized protein n=1 Tax=Dioscorea zingiberensis TaxID=325984 RepID=A0A9D5CCI0_9LILI|nr:hypothetical protein J5N97_023296 [Dioscorea zingiberensis]
MPIFNKNLAKLHTTITVGQDLWGRTTIAQSLPSNAWLGWNLLAMAITLTVRLERNRRCFHDKRRVFAKTICDIDFLTLSWFDAAHVSKKSKLVAIESIVKRSLAFTREDGQQDSPGRDFEDTQPE